MTLQTLYMLHYGKVVVGKYLFTLSVNSQAVFARCSCVFALSVLGNGQGRNFFCLLKIKLFVGCDRGQRHLPMKRISTERLQPNTLENGTTYTRAEYVLISRLQYKNMLLYFCHKFNLI